LVQAEELRFGFEATWWQNKRLLWVTDAEKVTVWRRCSRVARVVALGVGGLGGLLDAP